MNNTSVENKAQFYKNFFNLASNFKDYLSTGSTQEQERWQSNYESLSLDSDQQRLLQGFTRQLNILVVSGIWCGDCARQCPILQKFAEATEKINLRFIDNNQNPELRDEVRIQGGTRVPVAIFLSEDFNEVARFGDRTLSVYRTKALKELGESCDSGLNLGGKEDRSVEIGEWLDCVERAQLILRLSPALRKRYND